MKIDRVWKSWNTWSDYTISVLYNSGTVKKYHSDDKGNVILPSSVTDFMSKAFQYSIRQGERLYKLSHD